MTIATRILSIVVLLGMLACPGFSAGPPATIAVTTIPVNIATGNSWATVEADVRDASGQSVDDGTVVNWNTNLGFLYPLSSTTVAGKATARIKASPGPGTSTVTATSGAASGSAQMAISGAVAVLNLDPGPACLPADGTAKCILIARMVDSGDRLIADGTPVTFATNLGSITTSTRVTDSMAVAQFTAPPAPGVATVTATAGELTCETEIVANDNTLSFAIFPSKLSMRADGSSTCSIEAHVFDSTGRTVGQGKSISFSTDLGSITTPAMITEQGKATAQLTASTTTGSAVITATYGALVSQAEVVMADVPASIELWSDEESVAAGGPGSLTVFAMVRDSATQPVADGTEVLFTTSAGTIAAKSLTKEGIATAELFPSDPSQAAVTITGTCGTLSDTEQVYFAGPPVTIKVATTLDSLPADGTSVCAVRTIVTDSLDYPVPDGTPIAFSTTNGSVSSFGEVRHGQATSVLVAGSSPALAIVTASHASVSGTTHVVFAGAPVTVDVKVNASILPSDGVSSATVEATVLDSNGRAVADGTAVTFSTTIGSITSPCLTLDGKAAVKVTADTSPGNGTITATVASLQDTCLLTLE